jgi:hypothetical protein
LGWEYPGQFDLRMYRRNISRWRTRGMSDATCDGEQKVGWHLTCLIPRRSRIVQGYGWLLMDQPFFVKAVNQQLGKRKCI